MIPSQHADATSSRVATELDYTFTREILPEVSRTFALSIEMLPESLRHAVRTGYLLCRIVDTIEDEAELDPSQREALFDTFDALLRDDTASPEPFEAEARAIGLGEGSADATLVARAGASFRLFRSLSTAQREAMRPHIAEMSRGMREYTRRWAQAGRLHLNDLDDLERYCYFVAGTVGELLTALFLDVCPVDEDTRRKLDANAVSFGLGLQMVNIVKDVSTDIQRGVCYLPEALANIHNLTLERILEPENRQRGLAVVSAVCARARQHLQCAEQYTLHWPTTPEGNAVRLFCAVPLALAVGTLKYVELSNDTLRAHVTPKLPRATVMRVLEQAQAAVQTDAALNNMFREMHEIEVF